MEEFTHLAAEGNTFLAKEEKNAHCLIVLTLLIGYFNHQFPFGFSHAPTIFSQVLIFSLCQACARQPPRLFQRSGLHANCLSMAQSPPTYIMHLVPSTQSGLRCFLHTFKFRREANFKTKRLGLRWGKTEQPLSQRNIYFPFFSVKSFGVGLRARHFERWVKCYSFDLSSKFVVIQLCNQIRGQKY